MHKLRTVTLTLIIGFSVISMLLAGCSSNNCPLESTVLCNFHFYDSEGTAISYGDTITVTTLLPGYKTVYIYRKFGMPTLTLDHPDQQLTESGYTMSQMETRKDSVLVNKLAGQSSMQVPLSYFNATDTLIVNYASISRNDTIYIGHNGYPYVDLPECGTHVFHKLSSISSTDAAIDHIEINKPDVNYEGNENIRIFFNGTAQ